MILNFLPSQRPWHYCAPIKKLASFSVVYGEWRHAQLERDAGIGPHFNRFATPLNHK